MTATYGRALAHRQCRLPLPPISESPRSVIHTVTCAEDGGMCAVSKRPRSARSQKQVRFHEEPSTIVVPRFAKEDCWIDETSFLKFLVIARRKSSMYSEKRPDFTIAIQKLGDEEGAGTENCVKMLALSGARGLEQFVVPDLRRCRKRAVNHILLMQRKLRSDNIVNEDTMGYLLRGKSKQLSQSSRQRAFRLAQSDRLAVRIACQQHE